MPTLTVRQYATHRREAGLAGKTIQSVRQALDEGRIHAVSDKPIRIDPEVADLEWVENTSPVHGGERTAGVSAPAQSTKHTTATTRSSRVAPAFLDSRDRKELALALRHEIANAEEVGLLVRREVALRIYTTIVIGAVARFEMLPRRVAQAIPDLTEVQRREAEAAIRKELDSIRRSIADEPRLAE